MTKSKYNMFMTARLVRDVPNIGNKGAVVGLAQDYADCDTNARTITWLDKHGERFFIVDGVSTITHSKEVYTEHFLPGRVISFDDLTRFVL